MKVKDSHKANRSTVTLSTRSANKEAKQYKWWNAGSDRDLCEQLLASASYLRTTQGERYQQAAVFARLYGNKSLASYVSSGSAQFNNSRGLPVNRPTFNIVQSAIDTLISKISQSRPSPVFLTDNSDYKERRLAKQLNNFILGEFYQTKAYDKAALMLRDALVEGTGVLKIFETQDHKVGIERVLLTELLTDPNESIYGEPRQLYQFKLVDRDVLIEMAPKMKQVISEATKAYLDNSDDSSKTISDQVIVVEAWHLPSGKDAKDGRHTIACSSGIILDEEYNKEKFPFVFMHYNPRMLGFWGQGLAEQLMGTQIEINTLLYVISKSTKLVGVPTVWVEAGSKVVSSQFNNNIGNINYYRGIKPIYETPQIVSPELYQQLQRLIDYGFQQSGVSMLQASSQKPAGLNSGEAIRSYDDISTDRFAALSRRYDNIFIDLAYGMTDLAKDIAEREGKYQTVYPNKDGTKEINLPEASLLQDPFVIQVFNQSSLPKEPAGRMQKVTEMIQAGMISIKEGRRLLDYPDLEQVEKLANASEERIYQILDKIVEDGEYTPPDPFMDLQLANDISVQYYNLYSAHKLEEERCQMLRDFYSQVQTLKQASLPEVPGAAAPAPQANPEALPTSPLIPNGNPQGG